MNSFSKIIAGVMNWGKWGAALTTAQMSQLIEKCVASGVTTFDHADIYGGHTTEFEFGAAWKDMGIDRKDIQLITKCGIMNPSDQMPHIKYKHYDTSRGHIIKSIDQSLRNLQTDYIDLLLIHRPAPLMDPIEIKKAMESLFESGKVKAFGVSNFTSSQMDLIRHKLPIVANQIEISPLNLNAFTDGTLDYCMVHKITPMAWSPLGGGRLFGSLENPNDIARRNRLMKVAESNGWDLDTMIYCFLLHHPAGIHPVTGSSKIERILKAVKSQHIIISDAQWYEIYTAATGVKVP